ncbi:hypothetical protein TNCV_3629311 [Trichonephila clavipes]|nr:hypothetical protein TNCV_3629311 [Trichonephila clavipes]
MSACCDKDIPWGYPQCQNDRSIDSLPYGMLGMAMELISVAPAYCLKEPLKLGRRRGVPSVDSLSSPSEMIGGVKDAHPGV